jgi:hypothetical protein
MVDVHTLMLALEKLKKDTQSGQAKIVELSDGNTKLKSSLIKATQDLRKKAAEAEKLDARWRKRCEGLARDGAQLKTKLHEARAQAKHDVSKLTETLRSLEHTNPAGGSRSDGGRRAGDGAAAAAKFDTMRVKCVAETQRAGQLQAQLKKAEHQLAAQKKEREKEIKLLRQVAKTQKEQLQVRETPSWSRSWANFSLLQLHPHRNAWANFYILALRLGHALHVWETPLLQALQGRLHGTQRDATDQKMRLRQV